MVVADTGYFREKNVKHCHEKKVIPLIASKRESHHPAWMERFTDNRDMPLPDPDDAVACMRYDLQGKEGKEIYAKRKCTVEPVFGIIKNVLGFRQFSMRGLKKAHGEWLLVCMAYQANVRPEGRMRWLNPLAPCLPRHILPQNLPYRFGV